MDWLILYDDIVSDKLSCINIQKDYVREDFPMHRHDYTEIVIVLDGHAQHFIEGESYFLQPGDICVIKPSVAHGYQNPHNLRLCNIMFYGQSVFENFKSLRQLQGFQILFAIEPNLVREETYKCMIQLDMTDIVFVDKLTDRIFEEMYQKQPGYEALLYSLFIELIVFCSRKYAVNSMLHPVHVTNLANTVIFMEKHFCEALTLKQLAEMSCLSERHFCRTFQKVYHTSPFSYLLMLRLDCASNLLKHTTDSVSEVALRSGFADSNYFTRIFKKYKGISPREYRKLETAFSYKTYKIDKKDSESL